jgi:membrane-bound lytic murein transglycosylase A
MKSWFKTLSFIMVIFFSGCVSFFPQSSVKTLESFTPVPIGDIDFQDDLDPASLDLAIDRSINYYENVGRDKFYQIADGLIGSQQLKETLKAFRKILHGTDNNVDLRKKVAAEFNVYRVTGSGVAKGVLFTGYYEPLLEGSLERTGKYKYPLYRVPPDLIKN